MYKRATKKILLIEDNLLAQFAAKELLTHAGFSVDVADDGTDGVNLYRYYDYDLVILDIGLPDITGFEVAKRIRVLEKKALKPPAQIVALSASPHEYAAYKYKQAGINCVLGKPLKNAMLDSLGK